VLDRDGHNPDEFAVAEVAKPCEGESLRARGAFVENEVRFAHVQSSTFTIGAQQPQGRFTWAQLLQWIRVSVGVSMVPPQWQQAQRSEVMEAKPWCKDDTGIVT